MFARHLSDPPSEPAAITDESAVIPEGLPVHRSSGQSAYVNITYGCDNFCAYCIVPYARGRELSRRPSGIVSECRAALDDGYPEIMLLGQNVNSYGHDLDIGIDFPDLLYQIGALADLKRLRFTTSHPKDCSRKLLEAMANIDTVCEHLHLPVQAGDDKVLRRMGRGYSSARFRAIVQQARELMPRIAITTDVMVGFPGETPEQFERTLELFEQIRFDQAYMFKYNDRPGTKAAQMPDKVAEEEKQERLVELIDLQNRISRENNEALVGRDFRVLVEGPDERSEGSIRGRTRHNKIMIFKGPPQLAGQVVSVTATEAFLWGFFGELSSTGAAPAGL
jgi:tRNA-2-methylthio-N6-dimethylallyladenosine synthase